VEPIEFKPIHITLDINIKVDRELDEFFGFEDELEESTKKEGAEKPKKKGQEKTEKKTPKGK